MRTLYLGTPDFAVPPLQRMIDCGLAPAAVFSQPDRAKGRGKKISPTPVKAAALAAGLPVYQPESINSPEALAILQDLQPDVMVVAAYGQILRRPVLQLPPKGIINIHASLLPAYRGAAPIQRAIINGERETGVTIMFIEEGLDCGDMLLRRAIPIGPDEDVASLHDRLSLLGADMLIEALDLLERGQVEAVPQNDDLATYAPMLNKEDEKLDWTLPAAALHNRIRGMNPFPGVYTWYNGKRLKIKKAALAQGESVCCAPGEILALDGETVKVGAGSGAVILQAVQPEGKAVMSAGAFARGYALQPGDRLL